ncbi:MAG: hypothetical protein U9N35_08755 [Euryarchaeota archaeon]|nr:hypothetical protein [Euryarchaeota archaeon]
MESEIVKKLISVGLTKEEIAKKIEEKKKEVEGLLTKEGILSIIASEYGIELENETEELKISNITDGLKNVNLTVKVLAVYPVKELDDDKKVANVLIGDETGKTRLSLWNEQCEYLSTIRKGNVIDIANAISKKGIKNPELSLGCKGKIIVNPEGKTVTVKEKKSSKRSIDELKKGDTYTETRGTIVRLYRLRIYEGCPECFKKVELNKGKRYCKSCERYVESIYIPICEIGIDDSTGYIKCILFRDMAEELLGKKGEELYLSLKEFVKERHSPKKAEEDFIFENYHSLLGKEIVVSGKVEENEFLGLEFRVYALKKFDILGEAYNVLEGLK